MGYVKCPRCGNTFSDEEYKNHSCDIQQKFGGESDLRKTEQGEARGGDGSN